MPTLTPAQQEFLKQPFYAVVTTLRADGSPHSTVVWVDEREGAPWFNTAYGRAKPSNLERDPRASLMLVDPGNPYRWLAVDGHVSLRTDGADDDIDFLARKYTEHETYPWRQEGEVRVTVRIEPEHVTAYGIEE